MLFSKKAICSGVAVALTVPSPASGSGSSGAPWDRLAVRRTPTPRQARLRAKLQILMNRTSFTRTQLTHYGWSAFVPLSRLLGNPGTGPQTETTWEEQTNLSSEGLTGQLLPRFPLVLRQHCQH